ncbi:MAG TPA: flavin reductase family protein [Actinomycetota bacterium]|jgi:flavin reductase (DIM6/NTAB) family NADH-FMN oxidoreductase RutF
MRTYPAADAEAYRTLARTWAATVTVITARRRPQAITPEAPEADGFTATAFMMVSLQPPVVAIGVARDSGADDLIEDSDHLVVNLLSEEQVELSHAFSRHHRDRGDAWRRFPWTEDVERTPVLSGTTGAFSARILERRELGDHLLVLAEVTWLHLGDTTRTLVYQNRSYARLVPA